MLAPNAITPAPITNAHNIEPIRSALGGWLIRKRLPICIRRDNHILGQMA
jgi:hypothetical protein